jgi:hypothetical protein
MKALKPYAADFAYQLRILTHLEAVMEKWDGSLNADEHVRGEVKKIAEELYRLTSDLNLKISISKSAILSYYVSNFANVGDLRNRMRETGETTIQELSEVLFLPATDDKKNYFNKDFPFGKAVPEAFPEISEDV